MISPRNNVLANLKTFQYYFDGRTFDTVKYFKLANFDRKDTSTDLVIEKNKILSKRFLRFFGRFFISIAIFHIFSQSPLSFLVLGDC